MANQIGPEKHSPLTTRLGYAAGLTVIFCTLLAGNRNKSDSPQQQEPQQAQPQPQPDPKPEHNDLLADEPWTSELLKPTDWYREKISGHRFH